MSLSFVSSAVLSSTDGVSHNEEKSIESKEVQALRSRAEHKPLFEQMRANKEEEEAKREELQRSMMRGTRALDEEDCAHLDAIHKQRMEKKMQVQTRTEEELALFRAARADRSQSEIVIEDEEVEEDQQQQTQDVPVAPPKVETQAKKPFVPVIVKRKRRKQAEGGTELAPKKKKTDDEAESGPTNSDVASEKDVKKNEGALGSLLGGYGSSDDDSD